jgi:hypothetical protein
MQRLANRPVRYDETDRTAEENQDCTASNGHGGHFQLIASRHRPGSAILVCYAY